jgi:hypothetical protein
MQVKTSRISCLEQVVIPEGTKFMVFRAVGSALIKAVKAGETVRYLYRSNTGCFACILSIFSFVPFCKKEALLQ